MRVLALDAPIQPSVGAAGININAPAEELPKPKTREQLPELEVLDFGSVQIWLRAGRVDQIGVRKGYRGRLNGTIGIGSSIRDVEAAIGPVSEDEEDNLIVLRSPGWCFETEQWRGHDLADNGDAPITYIWVFAKTRE